MYDTFVIVNNLDCSECNSLINITIKILALTMSFNYNHIGMKSQTYPKFSTERLINFANWI